MCHQMPVDVESFHIAGAWPYSDTIILPTVSPLKRKLIRLNDKIAGLQFAHIADKEIFWELDKIYEELKQIIKEI